MEKEKIYQNGEEKRGNKYVLKSENQANYLTDVFGESKEFSTLSDADIDLLYKYRDELNKVGKSLSTNEMLAFVYGKNIKDTDSNTKLISSIKSLMAADGTIFKDGAEFLAKLHEGDKDPRGNKYLTFLDELQKRADALRVTIPELIDHLDALGMIDGNGTLDSTFANVEQKFSTLTSAISQLRSAEHIDAQTLDTLFTEFPDMMGKILAKYQGDNLNAEKLIKEMGEEAKYQTNQVQAVWKNYILQNEKWFDTAYGEKEFIPGKKITQGFKNAEEYLNIQKSMEDNALNQEYNKIGKKFDSSKTNNWEAILAKQWGISPDSEDPQSSMITNAI